MDNQFEALKTKLKSTIEKEASLDKIGSLVKKLGATIASTPKDFLQELLTKLPEMNEIVAGKEKKEEVKFESQVRWFTSKLVDRSVDRITNPEKI